MRKKTVEEYMEVIHLLESREGRALTGMIAREMNVKPSSATEMLQKLHDEGLINYETYSGATLTISGRTLARELMRRHKTIASFLKLLGLKGDVAEKDACQIEHHVSPETVDRLEKFVEYVHLCLNCGRSDWIEGFQTYIRRGRLESDEL